MKLKTHNPQTGKTHVTIETPDTIRTRLQIETNKLSKQLIDQGIANNQDEAHILIADALDAYAVKNEVTRIAKQRVDYGHVRFDCETPLSKDGV